MPPRVAVIGSGGREHALVRQLAASDQRPLVLAVPGNAGTAGPARNVGIDPSDHDAVLRLCRRERVDLVLVGPEDPLIDGLADRLRQAGVPVFGPGADGARLEGDKEFAKEVMAAAGVPTAAHVAFDDLAAAEAWLERATPPVVVKAVGAAQGKGVAVCPDRAAAREHLRRCLRDDAFGAAGRRVLIEECLRGPELSVLAVTDGQSHALLAPSRDHKRIGEGDTGPNTGGMGAYAPIGVDAPLVADVERRIVAPTLAELRRRGIDYRGVLYAGLMLTPDGPRVLEFNCRFGDPETQAVLPLLGADLLELAAAVAEGRLARFLDGLPEPGPAAPAGWTGAALTVWDRRCVVVVAAAPGYPGPYEKGLPLSLPADRGDAWIVHAGTRRRSGALETAGGRVLGAVGLAADGPGARRRAYALLDEVGGAGLVRRRDIAAEWREEGSAHG